MLTRPRRVRSHLRDFRAEPVAPHSIPERPFGCAETARCGAYIPTGRAERHHEGRARRALPGFGDGVHALNARTIRASADPRDSLALRAVCLRMQLRTCAARYAPATLLTI